jgi:predicted nucleic acid-binding protein
LLLSATQTIAAFAIWNRESGIWNFKSQIGLRAPYRLKLPGAIIAATAVERNATLITDDRRLRMLSAIRSSGTSASE